MSQSAFTLALVFYFCSIFVSAYSWFTEKKSLDILASLGSLVIWVGWLAHTFGLLIRWYDGGFSHPPCVGFYESLVFYSWGLVAVHLYLELVISMHWTAIFTGALASCILALALNYGDSSVIAVPAILHSRWFLFHVVMSAAGYGLLLFGAFISLLYLIKEKVSTEAFMLGASFAGLLITSILRWNPHDLVYVISKQCLIGLFISQIITTLSGWKFGKKADWIRSFADYLFFLSVLGIFVMEFALIRGALRLGGLTNLPLSFFPMGLTGMLSLILLAMLKYRQRFEKKLPSLDILERWIVVSLLAGFLSISLMLFSGAIWSYFVWNHVWTWEFKEIWAFSIWIFSGATLHLKIFASWKGRRLALMSAAGIFLVLFTFMGVNLFLPGHHSFG